MSAIRFDVKFVPVGTGYGVWNDPQGENLVQSFMPVGRNHGPMLGILHLGQVTPGPNILKHVIVAIGEDVRAGRYGNFAFIVSSEDAATRSVVKDIASAQDLPIFVTSSLANLNNAEPVGALTARDRETLNGVLVGGGTVTATEFAVQLGLEQTTAGNRLIGLSKKGYLQRVERPHPAGDQFVDPRSIRFESH
jgi:hypothetical protein